MSQINSGNVIFNSALDGTATQTVRSRAIADAFGLNIAVEIIEIADSVALD